MSQRAPQRYRRLSKNEPAFVSHLPLLGGGTDVFQSGTGAWVVDSRDPEKGNGPLTPTECWSKDGQRMPQAWGAGQRALVYLPTGSPIMTHTTSVYTRWEAGPAEYKPWGKPLLSICSGLKSVPQDSCLIGISEYDLIWK